MCIRDRNDTSPLDGTDEKAFEDWYVAMLLNWHNQDPVSQKEIDRNNAVFGIQKNRNPFIDHPESVSYTHLDVYKRQKM